MCKVLNERCVLYTCSLCIDTRSQQQQLLFIPAGDDCTGVGNHSISRAFNRRVRYRLSHTSLYYMVVVVVVRTIWYSRRECVRAVTAVHCILLWPMNSCWLDRIGFDSFRWLVFVTYLILFIAILLSVASIRSGKREEKGVGSSIFFLFVWFCSFLASISHSNPNSILLRLV